MIVIPVEEPFLNGMDAYLVNHDTEKEDCQHTADGIERETGNIIMTDTVNDIFTKPITHGIAVSMDKKDTEGRRGYRIYPFRMWDVEIPEIIKQHDRDKNSQNLILICDEEVAVPMKDCDHDNNTGYRNE